MTKRKLFVLILIFVLYELLVWVGSLLLLDQSALLIGFVLTVCGVTVLLVYGLVSKLSSAAQAPAPAPAADAPAPAPVAPPVKAAPDMGPVAALIQEANVQLAQSPTLANQRIKSTITDFPLFLVVGSAGSGKTSLFLASKRDPKPLAGQVNRDAVIVPTRVGNIWFVDDAVVVEGAGDFFSGEDSRWKGFLASFHRPGGQSRFARIFGSTSDTKLSGVLLCCDAGAFVGVPDSGKLAAIARLAQQRLRLVGEVFGKDFPVYVVFTKSDSIPYFAEYFGRLTESEDSQVLGCAFPQEATLETITDGLNKLYLSLADRRVEFLEREKDSSKRPGVYEFPREFKRLRGPLSQFLAEVFRANPLQPNPRLLGVYFAGTRRVSGRAIETDRSAVHKVGDVTRILRVDDLQKLRSQAPESSEREPEMTRWSFVTDLWQQILQRRQAAGATPSINRQQQFYRKLALMSAVGVSVLAIVLFLNSFLRNHFMVSGLQAAAQKSESVPEGAVPSLQNLREIDELRGKVAALDESGFWMHFGFNQKKTLRDPAWRAYYTRFRQYFLDSIVRRLDGELSGLPAEQSPSYQYGSVFSEVRTYRTITRSPNEASCPADSALVEPLMNTWRQERPPDPEAERIARDNFQFYVAGLQAHEIPDELQIASKDTPVQRGRGYLNAFRGLEPQYQQIIEQVNHEKTSTARLIDLMPNGRYRTAMSVQEEVPTAFTRAGFDRVQELIEGAAGGNSADSCVLGTGGSRISNVAASTELKAELRRMYIEGYIKKWSEFLGKANVIPYAGCGDAADKLKILKEIDSPILALMLMTTQNTTFPKHTGSALQQAGQALQKSGRFKFPFGNKDVTGGKATKAVGELLGEGLSEDDITNTFQPAHQFFEKLPPNPDHWTDARNAAYLDALAAVQQDLMALDHGGKCDESNAAANLQAGNDVGKAERVIDGIAQNFNNKGAYELVKTVLQSPLPGVRKLITTDPTEVTKRKITAAQGQLCLALNGLKTKYPFSSQGPDADLDQVGKVFDPKESFLAVLRQAVSDLGMKSDGVWGPKPDAPIKLTREFWTFFTKLSDISTALFPEQGGHPGMQYGLSVQSSPIVKEVTGTIDGELITMASKNYAWPVPPAKREISLRVISTAGGNTPIAGYSGPWAIFQLMANANHSPGTKIFQLINLKADSSRSVAQPIFPDRSPIIMEVTQFPNGVQSAFDKDFFRATCPAKISE